MDVNIPTNSKGVLSCGSIKERMSLCAFVGGWEFGAIVALVGSCCVLVLLLVLRCVGVLMLRLFEL
jgi:hypothetical protein